MTSINQKFAEHTTSIAFHLSLSRGMVLTLCQIRTFQKLRESGSATDAFDVLVNAYGRSTRLSLGLYSDTYITSMRALEARGLVEEGPKVRAAGTESEWLVLTEAGETVFKLLELAGLIARVEAAQQKVA